MDADWVILSACNTAAPDGTPGAEALSGLAKAFFYAGSRALLVSHWPVSSEAAVTLTTRMLTEYANDPGIGRPVIRHCTLAPGCRWWEPSTASEPDIRTVAPQVDFGLMMVSVEQYTRKMPRLNDSSKGVLVNHKYQHSFHSQNVFRVVE